MKVRIQSDFKRVKRAAQAAQITSLNQAGAAIRLTARRSVRRRKKSSPAGQPVSTRRGQARESIAYEVDQHRGEVAIGPRASQVGQSMQINEFGLTVGDEKFPKRPTMGPALQKITPRLPGFWAASVKGD